MKKVLLCFSLFIFFVCFTSCAFTYNVSEAPIKHEEKHEQKPAFCEKIAHVQYIRTNGYWEVFEYPRLIRITSRAELDSYYNFFDGIYSLGERDTIYSDSTVGFITACEKYDVEYFKESDLYLAVLEEGSGSVRHSVGSVEEGKVRINSIVPEAGTDDMAEWHIILEVNKGDVICGINDRELEVYSPDSLYEKFLSKLHENALIHLLDRYSITDATLKLIEKTNFGSIKDSGFNNPLGYNPGYNESPVWKMDFVTSSGETFALLSNDSVFVFGSIGLPY